MQRRHFLKAAGFLAVAGAAGALSGPSVGAEPPSASRLPRWRGFNLLEKFIHRPEGNPPFREADLEWMAEWGFDFARLPMSYRCWSTPDDWFTIEEREIEHVDRVVDLGRRHRVHINLNLHRAPGYCVNPPKEPRDLWTDDKALAACAFHWAHFARRYRGRPNHEISFDLLNEPPDIPEETYARVIRHLVAAIRAEDPHRLIIVDGLRWGRDPVLSLADLGVAQSTRGYDPMELSHYRANWVSGSDRWPEPAWPLRRRENDVWDKERLRRERIAPWQALAQRGVGVHVGECGPYRMTPHRVALTWLRDCLELWKEAGWGWALWNFRGDFGPLDSRRADVVYEDFRGHKLDREMLKLLQRY